jgi:Flp pilus assembly protein TadG
MGLHDCIRLLAWRFWRSREGSVAIQLGILMMALIGMSALGAEVTFALYKHRQQQSAADSAALSAAIALTVGHPKDPALEARAIAASAGFVDGSDNTTITVNNPPAKGPYAGNSLAIEVIVSRQQMLSMVSLFQNGPFTITARSVATQGGAPYCMLALDTSAANAIVVENNAVVSNPVCGVAANSTSSSALVLKNNAQVKGPVSVRGNWSIANNGQLSGHPLISNGPSIADPYASIGLTTVPGCTVQSGSGGNKITTSLSPGHFCNGWSFGNNATVNLAAGTYYIDQQLSLGNGSAINGKSVTLVINGNYAISFGNNNLINITAPTSGPYAGLAFLGLRTATPTVTQIFSNNTSINIKGAVYFPNQIVQFDNNGATTPGGCTQLIGRIIDIQNSVELDNNCSGTGVVSIGNGSGLSQLVE